MGVKSRRIRGRKRYHYSANRNKKKNDRRRRNNPGVPSSVVKNDWDPQKQVNQNYKDMGLALDPNQALPVPLAKDLSRPKASSFTSTSDWDVNEPDMTDTIVLPKPVALDTLPKGHVQTTLEELAEKPRQGAPRIGLEEFQFVSYMVETHGSDYEAMANDPKNIYQETSNSIRRRIQKLLSIPECAVKFLKGKGVIPEGEKKPKLVTKRIIKRWDRWEATKKYILDELEAEEAQIGLKDRLRKEKRMKEKRLMKLQRQKAVK